MNGNPGSVVPVGGRTFQQRVASCVSAVGCLMARSIRTDIPRSATCSRLPYAIRIIRGYVAEQKLRRKGKRGNKTVER
jgi:hypothetical protein